MKDALLVIQIISSIFLVILVLIQARGTGFGRTSGFSQSSSFSRRGLEKLIFRLTFVTAAVFIIVSILHLYA